MTSTKTLHSCGIWFFLNSTERRTSRSCKGCAAFRPLSSVSHSGGLHDWKFVRSSVSTRRSQLTSQPVVTGVGVLQEWQRGRYSPPRVCRNEVNSEPAGVSGRVNHVGVNGPAHSLAVAVSAGVRIWPAWNICGERPPISEEREKFGTKPRILQIRGLSRSPFEHVFHRHDVIWTGSVGGDSGWKRDGSGRGRQFF